MHLIFFRMILLGLVIVLYLACSNETTPNTPDSGLGQKPDSLVIDGPFIDGLITDIKGVSTVDGQKSDNKIFSPATWVSLPAGTFMMGSPSHEPCRETWSKETQHQVTLTRPFEIYSTEVTQSEFQKAMGYNPSNFQDCGDDCPVELVSWYESAAYCNQLSLTKKLAQCYTCTGAGSTIVCAETKDYSAAKIYDCPGYRLPTAAEWEYAYRAKTTTAYYSGDNNANSCKGCATTEENLDQIAWTECNSKLLTHPVAQKQPNAWGLFDMAGNVWEWNNDGWVDDLGSATVVDPFGDPLHEGRMLRGGSMFYPAFAQRAAYRHGHPAKDRYLNIGFRCVRTIPGKTH